MHRKTALGLAAFTMSLCFSIVPAFAEQEIDVTITDSAINPSTITVKNGKEVEIEVRNEGQKPHNLTIPQFSIYTRELKPGQSDEIEFTPSKSGSFSYFSAIDGTKSKVTQNKPEPGLEGTLNVMP